MSFSEDFIASEYRRLGYKLGWRFLTCPQRNIGSASVALVTINPGGDVFEPPRWSVENGSAYVIESWKGRAPGEENLQQQVRRMFELMAVQPAEVLSGYLVPFRSPSWADLPWPDEALRVGVALWHEIFNLARMRVVIAFGKEIGPYLGQVLEARVVGEFMANWGDQTIDVYRFGQNGKMLVLPHLSRFELFGRSGSESAFLTAWKSDDVSIAAQAPERLHPGIDHADIIRLQVKANPKTGKSRLRFDCYRDEMSVAEYEAQVLMRLGAAEAAKCKKDLKWDADPKRRFIRIERR